MNVRQFCLRVLVPVLVLALGGTAAVPAQNIFSPPPFSGAGAGRFLPEPVLPVIPQLGTGLVPIPIFGPAAGQNQCMRQVVCADNSNDHPGEYTTMGYQSEPFGQTKEGKTVVASTLTNANGLTAVVLTFGGVLYSMEVPDRDGKLENISANLATVAEYEQYRPYFGSLVGRYGNRIARGKFTLDGVDYQVPVNDGVNTLHGGLRGFDQRIWDAEPFMTENGVGVKLSYTAQDG